MQTNPPQRAYLRILEGGRTGGRFALDPDHAAVLGRAPGVELPMDPRKDLVVSGRHAEFFFRDGSWWIRDLESRNGTFLNEERCDAEPRPLTDGDILRFGRDGPAVRFEAGETATARIRRRGRRRQQRVILTALALLAAVGGGAYLIVQGERSERDRWIAERESLHVLVDSLLAREQLVSGELTDLDDALERSRTEVEGLRTELRSREGGGRATAGQMAALQRELEEATQALARQQLAAGLDFAGLEEANRSAVAMIFVESGGRVVTGTGFNVRDDAHLVTARHLLEDGEGRVAPERIAVQFSDSRQIWPGEVVAVSRTSDLAILRVGPIAGAVPRVKGLRTGGEPLQSGAPVAILGFPLGGSEGEGPESIDGRPPARPLLSAGVVRDIQGGIFEVQGYGEPGASGSPVLDGEGMVVGVVQGGERTERGGILVVIPTPAVLGLLREAGITLP